MKKLRQLLLYLSRGQNIVSVWKGSGFSSKDEAVEALCRLADSLGKSGSVSTPDSLSLSSSNLLGERDGIYSLIVNVDGASRGNPGPSAVAAVAFLPSGELLTSSARRIGRATNNVAEYRAVLEGIHLARELGAREVLLRLDSELVVKQLNGEYRIKNKELQSLARAVAREVVHFDSCNFEYIPREENMEADRLANKAFRKT